MKDLYRIFKAFFFWSYPRTSWQWDILCVLILAFIFLTPKGWFQTSELRHKREHQNHVSTVVISPEVLADQSDRGEIERQVRAVTGRAKAEVVDIRRRADSSGKTVMEVDIR
jgi:hypothetical protein